MSTVAEAMQRLEQTSRAALHAKAEYERLDNEVREAHLRLKELTRLKDAALVDENRANDEHYEAAQAVGIAVKASIK